MNTKKILNSPWLPIALFGFIVWFITKTKITTNSQVNSSVDIDEIKNSDKAINDSIKKGNKQTLSNNTYLQYADNLYNYINQSFVDEAGVMRVFRYIKNNTDFMLLNRAFGVRNYDYALFGFGFDKQLTMKGFLKAGLNQDEQNALISLWKSYGIDYSVYNLNS